MGVNEIPPRSQSANSGCAPDRVVIPCWKELLGRDYSASLASPGVCDEIELGAARLSLKGKYQCIPLRIVDAVPWYICGQSAAGDRFIPGRQAPCSETFIAEISVRQTPVPAKVRDVSRPSATI